MAGFETLILLALNHLVHAETWAQERLRPFSGSRLSFQAGPINLHLCINEQGLFSQTDCSLPADVVLTLPADAPFKFFLDRKALFSSVKLSGSVDLAESLAFVFRNLHWDVEADLASIIGDIPARRLTMIGTQLGSQVQDGARRVSENFVEFATEDAALMPANREIRTFGLSIDTLRDDVARLEKRIKQL